MATTRYTLGPNPKWYFVNKNGKPLSGGLIYTFSSLTFQPKFIYSDASNNFPLSNPYPIDADGTAGPFYFQFDSAAPDDGYVIEVKDANGNLIWFVNDYFGVSASGGGSTTTVVAIENLVKNNVFFRHMEDSTAGGTLPTTTIVAPSNHANLVANTVTAGTNPSPDIVFLKDAAIGLDRITFPQFLPLGVTPIATDLSAPVDYFNYECNAVGLNTRCLQIPITAKVQNISNTPVVGSIWAIGNGGILNQQITLQWLQYFGDGAGATVPTITNINTFNLVTGVWTNFPFTDTTPNAAGNNLGGPANLGPNDALFLQIQFQNPPNTQCNIGITRPTLYLGTGLPDNDFQPYDEIESLIANPRTGDVRISMNSFSPFGWVPCNDGVLSSGTNSSVTVTTPAGTLVARANIDTYPLYSLIWSIIQANPTYSGMYDNTGANSVAIGATAIADFSAGKQMLLTRALGRALSNAGQASNISADVSTGAPIVVTSFGSTWNVGQSFGEQDHQLTTSELASHTHTASAPASADTNPGGTFQRSNLTSVNNTVNVDPAGGDQAHNTMQPTSFFNVFLKL